MRNKTSAAVFALLLGGIGAHKFYLGRAGQGMLYLIFFWTFIPAFIGLIEGIMFLSMSDAEFNAKYNQGMMFAFAAPPPPQNIVVSVANTATGGGSSRMTRLKELHDLRVAGALSEAEYEVEKQKLLSSGSD